jgi:hypothetical protein
LLWPRDDAAVAELVEVFEGAADGIDVDPGGDAGAFVEEENGAGARLCVTRCTTVFTSARHDSRPRVVRAACSQRLRMPAAGRKRVERTPRAPRVAMPSSSSRAMRRSRRGCHAPTLTVAFASCRAKPQRVENPVQTPAYDDPPNYGARSPSFSRATILRGVNSATVFVSGDGGDSRSCHGRARCPRPSNSPAR